MKVPLHTRQISQEACRGSAAMTLTSQSGGGTAQGPAAVPEPGTAALFLAGLALVSGALGQPPASGSLNATIASPLRTSSVSPASTR